MKLFDFAYCGFDYYRKLASLAVLSPEKWSFSSNNDNSILKNYIEHTFSKVYDEGKVLISDDVMTAVFNTGLYANYNQVLYALFTKNKVKEKQEWYLDGFHSQYTLSMMGITELPTRANYFTDPSSLVFDTNCDIVLQYSHIFGDKENLERIPESVRQSSIRNMIFDGAVQFAKHKIDANYKTAVPQYYKGRIQLLIPLCLTNETIPDLALVVSRSNDSKQYMGHTCLTLEMAYNNARLIARPDSLWLQP